MTIGRSSRIRPGLSQLSDPCLPPWKRLLRTVLARRTTFPRSLGRSSSPTGTKSRSVALTTCRSGFAAISAFAQTGIRDRTRRRHGKSCWWQQRRSLQRTDWRARVSTASLSLRASVNRCSTPWGSARAQNRCRAAQRQLSCLRHASARSARRGPRWLSCRSLRKAHRARATTRPAS